MSLVAGPRGLRASISSLRSWTDSATRSFTTAYPQQNTLCAQCRRAQGRLQAPARNFGSAVALQAGHNRWSKIRHEKGAADKKKNAQRTIFSKNLTLFSKLYGPDPNLNPQLATVIAAARKAGLPKTNIDTAIARGQGKSTTGVGLEKAMLEVMMTLGPDSNPPAATPVSVALVIEIESDNKTRSLKDLRHMVKTHGGVVTPTAFLFERVGRSVLRLPRPAAGKPAPPPDSDDVLMYALEAGAEDVEQVEADEDLADADEADGSSGGSQQGVPDTVIWTKPNMTHVAAQQVAAQFGLAIAGSDILWRTPPGDDDQRAHLGDDGAAQGLAAFLTQAREYPDVVGVYTNAARGADVTDDAWAAVEDLL